MPDDAVFINYRRSDSSGYAGRLRDSLVRVFGQNRVFMDVGILGGDDWVHSIERALSASGALLAIIGSNWTLERLHEPGDRLRQELEAAMDLEVPIIPILVGGARMPNEADLPPSIRGITRYQAVRLTDEGWEDDVRRLIARLTQLVGPGPRPVHVETKGKEDTGSPLVGCVVVLVFLAIVGGVGFAIYQSVINSPGGGSGFPSGGDGLPDQPNPKITLSPTSGQPGDTITVTGTGYPADTDIRITLQAGLVAEDVSDADGGFRTTFEVPDTHFGGIDEVWASGGAFSDAAQFTIEGVD